MASLSSRTTVRTMCASLPGPAQAGFRPAAAALALAAAFSVHALPAAAQPVPQAVIHGAASFARNGGNLTVTTTNGAGTNHSAINWSSFSVPAGSVTRFIQPSAGSTSINRVVEANPSQILGQLASNGRLVLVNPWGITVGQGAQVDTAGFTASTLAMGDADARAGRLRFGGGGGAPLQVDGAIKARGGDVVLIAPQVRTGASAVIEADGAAVLAAGHKAEITGRGLEGILLEVQAGDSALNLGSLRGDAVGMFAGTLRHSGLVQAQAVSTAGGKVVLQAAADAIVDGSVSAQAGDRGGRIDVFGQRVGLFAGATLDASGAAGGGQVRVGGDYQGANPDVPNAKAAYVDANAAIRADATRQGDGGRVIVWSDENTRMAGRISARGGAQGGDGGFAEVSGHDRLQFTGRVDLRAPRGSAGRLLLDPNDLVISGSQLTTTLAQGSEFSGGPDLSYVSTVDLGAQLELGNVLLATAASSSTSSLGGGTITLAADATVGWGAATTLTLHANNGISLAGTVNASNAGSTLHLLTDQGSITQTAGSLRAGNLLAQASGGDVLLDQPNHVGVAAGQVHADTGRFVLRNTEDVTVGSVSAPWGGSNGIAAGASGGGVTVRSDAGSVRVRSNVAGGSLQFEAAQDVEVQGWVTLSASGQASLRAGRDVLIGAGRTEDPAVAVEHGDVTLTGTTGLSITAGRNVHTSGHGFDIAGNYAYDNYVGLSGNGGGTGGVTISAAGDIDFGAQTNISTQMAPVSVTSTGGSILGLVRATSGGTADGSIKLEASNGSVRFATLDAQGTGSETTTAKGGAVTVSARGNIDGSSIDTSGAYHTVEQADSSGGGDVSVVSSAGRISLDQVRADGGWSSAGVTPGRAGNILLSAAADLLDSDPVLLDPGVGSVNVATGIAATGGGSTYSAVLAPRAGGQGGVITIKARRDIVFGGVESPASIDVSGGQGGWSDSLGAAGGMAGKVLLTAGGSVTGSWPAEIRANGGAGSTDPASVPDGGKGGVVDIQAGGGVRLSSIEASGGNKSGGDTLNAGDAGSVTIQAAQDIAFTSGAGSIQVTGGSGYLGKAGRGGTVALTSTAGSIAVSGSIHADGQSGGTGGDAGVVTLRAWGDLDVASVSAISGISSDAVAIAPAAGSVSLVSDAGNIHAGSIGTYGTYGASASGGDGGTIELTALSRAAGTGNITVDDALESSGGHSYAATGTVTGGRGGAITLLADKDIRLGGSFIGDATTPTDVSIRLNGGSTQSGTGLSGTGGAAAQFRAVSTQGSIAIRGSIQAIGGAGATDGGAGGRIVLQAQGTGDGAGFVTVDGSLDFSGSHGNAGTGGAGGSVFIRADKAIQLAYLTGDGGLAYGAAGIGGDGGGVDVASAAGGISLGRPATDTSPASPGSISVIGGAGEAGDGIGGGGGSILLAANGGALFNASGAMNAGGGSGGGGGGAGGTVTASALGSVTLGFSNAMGGQDRNSLARDGGGGSVKVTSESGDVNLGDVYVIGSTGGNVTVAAGGGNLAAGSIMANASSNGVPATGGNGGKVSLEALSMATEAGNITVTGSIDAEGSWASTAPGAGGVVTVSASRNIATGSVRATGGWTYAPSSEAALVAATPTPGTSGSGGTISIDSTTGDISAGSLDVSGQQGGTITVRAQQGNIAIQDASAWGTAAAASLPGGTITLEALGTAADRGNITVSGSLQADGSYGSGGPAGAGGVVSVHADKAIVIGSGASVQGGGTDTGTLDAADGGSISIVSEHGSIAANWINAAGGSAADGRAGHGGTVLLQALGTGGTVSVGDTDVSGGWSTQGVGGSAGTLTAQADQLVSLAHISARGGGSSGAIGGAAGTVSLSSTSGDVNVANGIDAGGGGGSSGGRGGLLQLHAGGAVAFGSIWADGGAATLAGGTAGNGGTVDIAAAGNIGNVGEGTASISAGGGSGYPGVGGNGGTVRLASSGGSILVASVAAAGGYGAPGGQGGTVSLAAALDIASTVRSAGGGGSTYENAAGANGGDGGTAVLRFGGSFTGSVDAEGGSGESGGTANASGGTGGAGGVIDLARTSAGTLPLQGLQLLANGGGGGSAAYESSGVGGSGGKGGSVIVDAQLGALALTQDPTTSSINVLNASAGHGGLDGAQSAVAASGAAGSVTLHAAGDLGIGANALYLGDAIANFSATAGGLLQQGAALSVQGGEVRLTADRIDLQGTVQTGTGRTVVSALTAARPIRLGGIDDGSALHLSQDEINRISAGTLQVGDAGNTGGITVAGPTSIDPMLAGTLSLVSGGAIAQAAASPLAAQALNADGASVTLGDVSASTLSGRAHAGNFTVAQHGGGPLTVGTVDGVAGIVAAGPVTLTSDGSVALADSITGQASGDAVVLSAPSLSVGTGAGISTPAGRWLVYLPGPDGNQFGTLASGNYALWGRTFGANPPGTIAEAGNRYLFATQPGVDIVADAATKVYDGSTSFNLSFHASGFVDAALYQNAFLQDSAATFSGALGLLNATKNVGSYAITQGTLASSYRINSFTGNTATITPAPLSLTGLAALGKVYDGTTAAPLQGTATVAAIGSDVVSVAGSAGARFADKNVGTAKPVTLAGLSLSGADAGNYQLVLPTLSADITPAALTVSGLAAASRVYDTTTFAALQGTATVTPFGTDLVSIAGTAAGSFADKNVGKAKPVSVGGLALAGADAGNYVLRLPTLAADITPATIGMTGVVANAKVYDTTTAATLSGTALASGVLGSDAVTLSTSGMKGSFADKNVGTAKAVSVSGVTLAGADAGNYVFVAPTGLATDITPALLTVGGLVAGDKVYDATRVATLSGQAGVSALAGDTVTLAGTASGSFADKNVGSAKPVTLAGLSLTGADAGNYQLVLPTLSADITPAALTVSGLAAASRVYDTTTFAALQGTATVTPFGTDLVSIAGTAAGSFADKNVGKAKPVSVGGLSLAGGDAGNYVLRLPTLAADITPATIGMTGVVANAKVYDTTTAATLSGTALASGVLGSDAVTLSTSGMKGSFADKNVGTAKAVSVSGVTLAGADAGNYVFVAPTGLAADITPALLTVGGLVAGDKVYDATRVATLTGQAGVSALAGDTVTLAGTASGSFADKNVGSSKPVTVSGLSLAGADAGNYQLTVPALAASITPATVTVAGLAASDKVYDGTTAATLAGGTLAGVLGSDAVSFTAGTASFADPNAGAGKAVTLAGSGLAGADAANYRLQAPTPLTASITPRPLTIRPVDRSKNEGQLLTFTGTEFQPQNTGVGNETIASVSLSSAGAPAEAATGVYAIRAQGATGTNGFVAGNYAINYVDGALTVLASAITAPVNSQVVTFATLFVEEANAQRSAQVKADELQKKDDKSGNHDDIVVTGNACKPS